MPPTQPSMQYRAPEPVTPEPARRVDRVVYTQRWSDLLFLHWAVPPERVEPYLPPGVRPDVIDGVTYVGLIPFGMHRIGLGPTPGLPYFGTFAETNVRLYSVDAEGRRGVVFVSLDASRLAPVVVARTTAGLPYLWSSMRRHRFADQLTYTCSRRWPGPRGAQSLIRTRIGEAIVASPTEHFLTARWGLHLADRRGRTAYWPNDHPQWELRRAEVLALEDELLAAAGFTELSERPPDSALYSPGLRVTFGPRVLLAGR